MVDSSQCKLNLYLPLVEDKTTPLAVLEAVLEEVPELPKNEHNYYLSRDHYNHKYY